MNLLHKMSIQEKYRTPLFIMVLLSLLSGGCSKKLNLDPLDQLDNQTFWTSQSNAMLALTAVYRGSMSVGATEYNPTDWWSPGGMLLLDFASDNAYDRRGNASSFEKFSDGTLTANLDVLDNYWVVSYAKIARANYFLENVGKTPTDTATINRYTAEARFIRAAQYFYLSQYWGPVPLVTKTLTAQQANTVTKSSKQDVVNFVISEMTAAAAELPRYKDIPAAQTGRACSQAALAFLGRIQLSQQQWASAAGTYETIINDGDNSIDPDYASIFLLANENSPENIYSTQYVANTEANGMEQFMFPAVAGGWTIYCPLASLVESYDFTDGTPFSYTDPRYNPANIGQNRDPRLKYTVLYNGAPFGSHFFISHPDSTSSPDRVGQGGGTSTNTGYSMKKFADPAFTGAFTNYGGNLPVIRYAEILLSYLEARLENGDPIDQNLLDATINKVRGRASVNMPPITVTDPTQLRTILRKERRVEMALEGTRLWDLLRWNIAGTVLQGDFYGAAYPGAVKMQTKNGTPDPYSRWYVVSKAFRQGVDNQWPIPQAEVNINPGLQ